MKKLVLGDAIRDRLARLLKNSQFESLSDIAIDSSLRQLLLFPTDDYLLSLEQFEAVVCLLEPNETLCVMQMDEFDGLLDARNSMFVFSEPYAFEEYQQLNLYSMTMLFSESCEWFIITDELLAGGEGLFVGKKDLAKRFAEQYGHLKEDRVRYEKYWKEGKRVRGVCDYHMKEMLKRTVDMD